MDKRRLIMGDWHPVVRDPIDLLRGALIAAIPVAAMTGRISGAIYLAVSAVGALVARRLALPRLIDLAFVVALTVTGFGEALGFYDRWNWFDRVVHFIVPMLFTPVAYIALARADIVSDPHDQVADVRHAPALLLLSFSFGVTLGAVWEIVEWSMDALDLSNLSENNDDTIGDLIADTAGALAGAGLLLLWTYRGWGAVRRIPGVNTREGRN